MRPHVRPGKHPALISVRQERPAVFMFLIGKRESLLGLIRNPDIHKPRTTALDLMTASKSILSISIEYMQC